MFGLTKQVFIALSSFIKSLVTTCVLLNNESCMIIPFLIHLNLIKLKYYPLMISLDKCSGICNAANVLYPKIYVPKGKDINVKVFNLIKKQK